MKRFNGSDVQGRSREGRLLSVAGRLKVVAAVALVLLAVGVVAAYGALGSHDTATGTGALASEAGGNENTADGFNALLSNTTGANNTAAGVEALNANTTGANNTATGWQALYSNTFGFHNTATGLQALYSSTGSGNTAAGLQALFSNTTGNFNTAVGRSAGEQTNANTTGSYNTFLGYSTGLGTPSPLNNATAVGALAVVSRSDSVALGDATANVGIGNPAPQSRLQIGTGGTSTFGDYLQIPVVTSTAKTPPASDCGVDGVGRLVLVQNKKKVTLFACSTAGVWIKV